MEQKKNYFSGLQGLRLFAFLNVFWLHVSLFRVTNYYQSASWAVSFFICLSGFLYGVQLSNDNLSLKNIKGMTVKWIIKIYPLYIFSMFLMLGYSGIFATGLTCQFMKKFILNALLLQSWSHNVDIYYGFTGVGWYLSVLFFFVVICVPSILIMKKGIFNKKSVWKLLMIDLLLLYCWFFIVIKKNYNPTYYLYIFPPARVFEFWGGILVGFLFKDRNNDEVLYTTKSTILYSFVEIGLLVILVLSFKYIETNTLIPNIWQSTIWVIPNFILIYVYALGRGIASRYILGNKLVVRLGQDTFDTYLIHQVVNIYFSNAMGAVAGMPLMYRIRGQIYILVICFFFAELRQHAYRVKINKRGVNKVDE